MITPAADVYDKEREYQVLVDLPGVRENEVKVDLGPVPGTLAVRARSEQEESREGQPLRVERCATPGEANFQRIVPVAWDANVDDAEWELRDGVLSITVPKKEPPAKGGGRQAGGGGRKKTK